MYINILFQKYTFQKIKTTEWVKYTLFESGIFFNIQVHNL